MSAVPVRQASDTGQAMHQHYNPKGNIATNFYQSANFRLFVSFP